MSAARGYVVYQYAYEYVFAQPVCPVHRQYVLPVPTTVCHVHTAEEFRLPDDDETVNGTTQSWTLPVMVVPFLVMLLLGFWVVMVLYHKKKGVAKPTVGAEPGIQLLDEPVAAASTIDKLKTDPAPTATKDDKAVKNPKAALHVQTVSDTPAPTSVMAHSAASTKDTLDLYAYKLRLKV